MLVCCSNKLCSRIVGMSNARTSADFPGYRWCRQCWPQLESTTEKRLCTAPGPRPHEFNVSRFFYESQGQILPRLCPKHNADGEPSPPPTATTTPTGSDPDAKSTCRFGSGCTNMECVFLHPTPPCGRGKTCEKASCPYRHPIEDCRFQDRCTKLGCVYRHTSGGHGAAAARSAPAGSFSAPDCQWGARCTNRDCRFSHPVSFCPRGAACTKKRCRFRHPKKPIVCRHGANCIDTKCVYEHPPAPSY